MTEHHAEPAAPGMPEHCGLCFKAWPCEASADVHRPFTDDGVTYCGWDGHEGCGEVWPCRAARAADFGAVS